MIKIIAGLLCLSFLALAVFGPKEEKYTAIICANTWMAVWVILYNTQTKKQ